MTRWWFAPAPLGRVALLRVLVYLYVPVDVLLTGSWARSHAELGRTLYHPLHVGRLLHLPIPTPALVVAIEVCVVAASLAAAWGRAPRLSGSLVAVLYFAWMLIAMSYGKVDHDRFAFLVALAVLPTVGRARAADREPSERAGWALRCVQVSVMLTYFLAAWAKIRFGGWNWPSGSTLELALLRRNTPLSHWLIDKPQFLVPMQFAMIGAELLSPLVLLARSDRSRAFVAVSLWSFHVSVYAGVTIIFLPHCVAIASFVPLETWWARLRSGGGRSPAVLAPDRPAGRVLPGR